MSNMIEQYDGKETVCLKLQPTSFKCVFICPLLLDLSIPESVVNSSQPATILLPETGTDSTFQNDDPLDKSINLDLHMYILIHTPKHGY